MKIKKPTYEELELEVKRLRELQGSNKHTPKQSGLDSIAQKKAKALTGSNRAALENLTNTLTDIVISVKMPERVIEWCNNSVRAIAYQPTEIIGQTTAFLFTQEAHYLDFGIKLQESISEGNGVFISEQLFKKKNGEEFTADVRVTCDLEDGKIVRATSIIRDVTEQKLAEEKLVISEDKFRNLYENSPYGIVICEIIRDNNGKAIDYIHLELNGATELNTGFKVKDLVGRKASELVNPDVLEELTNKYDKVVVTKEEISYEQYFDIYKKTLQVTVFFLQDDKFIINFIDITEQKKAVEELEKEKQFLEAVFDTISDGIVSCDANGILNRFNKATKEFHGLPNEKIHAEQWAEHYDLYFPDGKTPLQKKDIPLFKALTEDIAQDVEIMIIPKGGKKRLLVSNGKVLKDADGKTLGAVVAMHDITKQRKIQDELKENEEKYRSLFDNAPLSYQSLDEEGRFVDINPSWLRTLGYDRNEVIGKYYADFLHPDWKPHFEKNFPAFKKRGYVNDVQFKIKHKKGHYLDISFEGCIGYLPDGSFKQTYCVFQDITEKKKAEGQLKMFNRVIDHSLNAFDIVNHKGEFIYVNQAYADMWGYETTDEIIGTSPVSHCFDENLAGHIISELKENGEFISEIKAKRKDGSVFDALMYARLDYDENGNEIYPTTSLDITDRKQAENKLVENELKFRTLFEESNDAIIISNIDASIVDMNKEAIRLLGFTRDELLEKHTFDLHPKEELDRLQELFKGSKKSEDGQVIFESKYLTKSGNTIDVDINSKIYDSEKGLVQGIVRDITKRKQVEEEVSKLNGLLNQTGGLAKIGGWELDLQTNLFYFTDEMYNIYEIEQGLTLSLEDGMNLYPPETQLVFQKALEDTKERNVPFTTEALITTKAGNEKWVRAHWKSEQEKGKVVKLIGTLQDITEVKQTDKALIEGKERLRLALEINNTGAWELDLNDHTSTRTLLHDQIFGYKTALADWTFEMFLEHVIEEDRKRVETLFMEAVNTISDWGFECRIQRPDGEIRWISAIGRHIIDSIGKPSHMSGVVQDITESKNAQQSLQEITEHLQLATEGANLGTWHWNIKTEELLWSSQMKELFDVPQDEVMSYERFSETLHPEDREKTNEAVKIAIENHADYSMEYRCIWRDGSVHWLYALGRGYYDESGESIRMEGVAIDINDKKNAELLLKKKTAEIESQNKRYLIINEQFKRSNQLLEESQSIAKLGGWELNLLTNELFWTAETYRVHDTCPEEFNPTVDAGVSYFLPESKQLIIDALDAAATQGLDYDLELETYTTKGRKIDVRTTGVVTKVNGNPVKIAGIFQDITEQKNAQKALVESEKRLNEAQRMASIGYWIQDVSSEELVWSDETYQIFEQDKDSPGNLFDIFIATIHSEDRDAVTKAYQNSLKTKMPYEIKHRLQMPDGRIKYVHERCETEYDANGEAIRSIGTVQDISEQKKAAKELEESQKKYQSLFDNSPVPLWEEDFSGVKRFIKSLQKQKITNFRAYFQNKPDEVKKCVQLIKINDINNSVLKLHDAESKEEFYNGIASVFTETSYESFIEELITIAEGHLKCEFESIVKTINGKEKAVHLKWMVVPGYENTLEKVYLSTIDITDRKNAEEELKKHRENLEELVNERTKELETKNNMLERINKAFVGRELKMRELKKEIQILKEEK